MTAEQVRKIAQEVFNKKLQQALDYHIPKIDDYIQRNANIGRMEYTYNLREKDIFVDDILISEALSQSIHSHYSGLGFKVSQIGEKITIKW